ncbi:hypothetical protein FLONG3_9904 [Fusarium longipes]|uniref:Uncharacterized protein n=1 Tax=Fusarium longipes TaxID=694270 RepID=A0A395RTE9_9HYPO|nr:hypothetical protein FLONG3_9904 [Fusarium longipes]
MRTTHKRTDGSAGVARDVEAIFSAELPIATSNTAFCVSWARNPQQKWIVRFKEKVSKLEDFVPILDRFETPDSSILGHLEFSPPIEISHRVSGSERLRDWALIELDESKFPLSLGLLRTTLPSSRDLDRNFGIVINATWMSQDTVIIGPNISPESELWNTKDVFKYGKKTTEYTFRFANGVKPILRYPLKGGPILISSEWCIIGDKEKVFAADGDSGSCVFDRYGSIGGMITSGLKRDTGNEGFDVMYAAPWNGC